MCPTWTPPDPGSRRPGMCPTWTLPDPGRCCLGMLFPIQQHQHQKYAFMAEKNMKKFLLSFCRISTSSQLKRKMSKLRENVRKIPHITSETAKWSHSSKFRKNGKKAVVVLLFKQKKKRSSFAAAPLDLSAPWQISFECLYLSTRSF